jgi:hypothetical protein
MAKKLRAALEIGPRGKKVATWAIGWPGLERGAATPEKATEKLLDYLPRYEKVAKLAGLDTEFAMISGITVVEEYPGTGSTDFWGISFAFSSVDTRKMTSEQLERELSLMQSCWRYFDEVRARVSPVMLKGPRGGGRDRDRIVRHTLGTQQDSSKKLAMNAPQDRVIVDAKELKAFRKDYCNAIRTLHAEGQMARSWPLRYLIRHTAYHTMDHAWEMEDKDLTD